jgi:hypothetical protein
MKHKDTETIRIGNTDYSVHACLRGISDHWDSKGMREWAVCIKKPGSIRWFRFFNGTDTMELDDFLDCIRNDAFAYLTYGNDINGFIEEFGYGDDEDHAGRRAWRGCQQTAEKLQSLFGDDYEGWTSGFNSE